MTSQPQPETANDLIEAGEFDRVGDYFYALAAQSNGTVKVRPAEIGWEDHNLRPDLFRLAETDPADADEARRWCVVVDGIPECNAETNALIRVDGDTGTLLISALSGPSHDHDVAVRIVARDLKAEPAQPPVRKALTVVGAAAAPRKAANDNAKWPGLVSSGELVGRFTPPDYSIDGIVQSGFVYSLTASTGTGKTAILLLLAALKAQGLPLGDREAPQGRVVYLAGENPDDVTMRWIGAAHHMGFDPGDIDVHFVPGVFDITQSFAAVSAAVERAGGASLVIIDTSAAYFTGDDENGNVAMGKHARNLRQLTTLPGSPAVIVAAHPTKNADQSNLLPRGGGAFIAEMDGNLTAQKTEAGTVKLHWQGKFRGPDFKPIHFDLATVTAPGLVDSKGREIPTVMASIVSEGEARQRRETARNDEDLVLVAIESLTAPSNAAIAEHLGWKGAGGEPHKRRAQTATTRLRRDNLAELGRHGWHLTKSGQTAATAARAAIHAASVASDSTSRLLAKFEAKRDRTEPNVPAGTVGGILA